MEIGHPKAPLAFGSFQGGGVGKVARARCTQRTKQNAFSIFSAMYPKVADLHCNCQYSAATP